MKDVRRFVGASLLILAALVLTFRFKDAIGWSPDIILPVLAVVGFMLDIYSLAFLVAFAVWVLNWQMGISFEMLILVAVSLVAWFGKKFLPLVSWITLAVTIGAGEILLYAFTDVFSANIGFIISNTAFAVLFGLALFTLLEWVYEER